MLIKILSSKLVNSAHSVPDTDPGSKLYYLILTALTLHSLLHMYTNIFTIITLTEDLSKNYFVIQVNDLSYCID